MSTERGELAAELQTVIARKSEPGKLSWIGKLAEALGVTARHHDAQAERLAAIEARIAALEDERLAYAGVHQQGREYSAGEIVTRSGSLWLAERDTAATPGNGASAWRLVVKRGDFR